MGLLGRIVQLQKKEGICKSEICFNTYVENGRTGLALSRAFGWLSGSGFAKTRFLLGSLRAG